MANSSSQSDSDKDRTPHNDPDRTLVGPSESTTTSQSPLESVGEYEIEHEIARGGMGIVYRARHKQLNRTVALKMILRGQFASENDVQRFYQEAEAAARLDHPGIVPIFEIGEHEGNHFFSMKLIDGGSLSDKLPCTMGDLPTMVRCLAKVARAVHHAHQRGILHRDIKPENILIEADGGEPRLTGLGAC